MFLCVVCTLMSSVDVLLLGTPMVMCTKDISLTEDDMDTAA